MEDDIDIFADAEVQVAETDMSRLSAAIARRQDLESEVEQARIRLKSLEAQLRELDERVLPELFEEVGVSSFETRDGVKVTLREKLYGSLPKTEPARSEALNEVFRHGGDALLKTVVQCSFPKGERQRAAEAEDVLREAGFAPEVKEDIHPSTYMAWVREMLEKGVPLNLETLSVYPRRFLEVKKEEAK